MAQEILELQVNSNVKGVTKDVDALATSVEKAYDAEAELSKNIQLQNQFIADQEVELARLKAIQDSIPKGGWYAGQSQLNDNIKSVTSSLRTEKAALKKLTAEQKSNTKEVRSAEIAQRKNNNAAIRGIQHFQIMGVSIRKLKYMVRGIRPTFKLLFGTIKSGMAATGIGLLIVAFGTLMGALMGTKKGAALLKAGVEGLKVIFAPFLYVIEQVADGLTWLFGIDSTPAVSAAEQLENAYDSLGKEMDKIALKELRNQKAKVDNKRIIDDVTKSEEERLQASKDNAAADKEILEAKIAAQKKVLAVAEKGFQKNQSWYRHEQKNALAADEWNKVATDNESAFSKARDATAKSTKGLNTATQELQKLENQRYTDSLAAEDELAAIRKTAEKQAEKDAEELAKKALDTKKKNADAWIAKQKKTAAEELSIAKQLEKVKQELYYRTLETAEEVEKAKLEDAKEAADQAILDSTASQEVKDAALIVLEEKYQSDLLVIQKKYVDKAQKEDDAAWDKKIKDNDKWNKKQLADQEKAIADKKKTDDIYETEKQKSISMGFDAASSLAKEGSVVAKGIAVARTVYNTQQAIMNAMATVPAPWNIAQSIATGVMGAASIQKILSANPEGGGGGGVNASVPAAPPAPEMMSGAFTLGGGQAVEPARAYVVSDDITNNQNKLAIIRRRATI